MTHTVLLVFAFVCFFLAAADSLWQSGSKVNLVAAGLACWVASLLF